VNTGRTKDEWLAYRVESLLTSCTTSTSLSATDRQRRIKICTRMYWALCLASTLEQRLEAPPSDIDAEVFGILWKSYINETPGLILPWWQRYFSWEVLTSLRTLQADNDVVCAFHAHCACAVLVHHSLVDLEHRMEDGSVKIYIPPDWTPIDVAVKLNYVPVYNLNEFIMAVQILPPLQANPSIFAASVEPSHIAEGRQVQVVIGRDSTTLLSGSALKNELCLQALNTFLSFWSTNSAEFTSPSDKDLILGSLQTLAAGWELKGTTGEGQATFAAIIDRAFGKGNRGSSDTVQLESRQQGVVTEVLDILRPLAQTLDDSKAKRICRRLFAGDSGDFLDLGSE